MANNIRQLISKLIKRADDMALMKGQVDYSNRDLRWTRYLPGQFHGKESLPESAEQYLQNMMDSFRSSFERFATNPKNGRPMVDYKDVIFAFYAHDKAVSESAAASLPPELQTASRFVNNSNVALTPSGGPDEIGSPFWFSYYGYAYSQVPGVTKSEDSGKYKPGTIVSVPPGAQCSSDNNSVCGNISTSPIGQGFGLFVQDERGESHPVVKGQNFGSLKKLFEGKGLTINSDIAMFDGPRGKITPAAILRPRKGKTEELMPQAQQAIADRNAVRQSAEEQGAKYKLTIDGQGAFTATNYSDSSVHYLSQEQVKSLIDPKWFGSKVKMSREQMSDIPSAETQGKKRVGPWRATPEAMQQINQDPQSGFEVLKNLREVLNEQHRNATGKNMGTALEGIKVLVLGPQFSNPDVTAPGQTTANPQMSSHDTMLADQSQATSGVAVERLGWVVVANELKKDGEGFSAPFNAVGGQMSQKRFDNIETAYAELIKRTGAVPVGIESLKKADQALRASIAGTSYEAPRSLSVPEAPGQPAKAKPAKPRMRLMDGKLVPVDSLNQPSPAAVEQSFQQPIKPKDQYYSGYNKGASSLIKKVIGRNKI